MEEIAIGKSGLTTSRVGLGTWAMGGWMWGGTDEAQSIATIHSAIDRGVTLIDTAPVYGFGRQGALRQCLSICIMPPIALLTWSGLPLESLISLAQTFSISSTTFFGIVT